MGVRKLNARLERSESGVDWPASSATYFRDIELEEFGVQELRFRPVQILR
jgi:hypothetical protein